MCRKVSYWHDQRGGYRQLIALPWSPVSNLSQDVWFLSTNAIFHLVVLIWACSKASPAWEAGTACLFQFSWQLGLRRKFSLHICTITFAKIVCENIRKGRNLPILLFPYTVVVTRKINLVSSIWNKGTICVKIFGDTRYDRFCEKAILAKYFANFFSHEKLCKAGAAVFAKSFITSAKFSFQPLSQYNQFMAPVTKAMAKIRTRPLSFGLCGHISLLLPVLNALRAGGEGRRGLLLVARALCWRMSARSALGSNCF